MNDFKVAQLDHVEVFVPDQQAAANWYEKVLGLKVLTEHLDWAVDGGPMMISSDSGQTMIALFKGTPNGTQTTIGLRRVAFRVSGEGFNHFLQHIDNVAVFNGVDGPRVTANHVEDHDKAWSIYFTDPYGNKLEVTTYDYKDLFP